MATDIRAVGSKTRTPAELTDADALDRVVGRRWSCRRFLPEPLPRTEVYEVLEAARWAPSWRNGQPWRLHIVGGPAIDRFRAGLVERTSHGPRRQELVVPDTPGGPVAGADAFDDPPSRVDLFGAPQIAILTTTPAEAYRALDCGMFLETFLLAAEARGIASAVSATPTDLAPFIRDFLGLGDDREVLLGVAFGRPDLANPANRHRTNRMTVDQFATFIDA